MNLYSDTDIKIAGDKPLDDIKKNQRTVTEAISLDKNDIKKAREWGKKVAIKFMEDAEEFTEKDDASYYEMLTQRRMLLSFTATVGFEQFCSNDALAGIAQASFIDTIKNTDIEVYKTSEDTGAFSFYYLAFRRGGEVERRIGQTFAMLCSHDGDPIYKELGEALYCWFLSIVKKYAPETV